MNISIVEWRKASPEELDALSREGFRGYYEDGHGTYIVYRSGNIVSVDAIPSPAKPTSFLVDAVAVIHANFGATHEETVARIQTRQSTAGSQMT